MKRITLCVVLIACMAAPAFAYTKVERLTAPQQPKQRFEPTYLHGSYSMPAPTGATQPGDEAPTNPVPEPGTMILASFGLLTFAVSRSRRRDR